MHSGKFKTQTYTFLMDFTGRTGGSAAENNYRDTTKNTFLFSGEVATGCKADNKKYRWTVISMCSNSYCQNDTKFLMPFDNTDLITKGKASINF
jgi:hypothetical protein